MTPFELMPFTRTPERAEIISEILRNIAKHETIFTGLQAPCEASCVSLKTLVEMCETCRARMATVAFVLGAPNTRTWEVWNTRTSEVSGIIYFSDIIPTQDAKGHYVFFDGRLTGKTEVIEEAVGMMFEDFRLARMTVEIPAPFVALARHAQRKLSFGGPFRYKGGLSVEGVKRGGCRWRGQQEDLLILGRLRTSPRDGGDRPQA